MADVNMRVLFAESQDSHVYGTIVSEATNSAGKKMYAIKYQGSPENSPVRWIKAENVFLLEDQAFTAGIMAV